MADMKVVGATIVAGMDLTPVLEPAEHVLDLVPYFLFEVGVRDHMMAFNTSVHAVLSAESTLGGP
jgi:hypothetical protein